MKTNFMNGDCVTFQVYSHKENKILQRRLFELGFSWGKKGQKFLGLGSNYPIYLILNSTKPMQISWNHENLAYQDSKIGSKLNSVPIITIADLELKKMGNC